METYVRFARMSRKEPGSYRKAEEIFDDAIAKNPASARAHLARGLDRQKTDLRASAVDIARARELDKDDADIILAAADIQQLQGHDDQSRVMLDEGVRKHPKDRRFYLAQQTLEQRAGRKDSALSWLNQGLDAVGADRELLWFQARLLLDMGKADGARKSIERLRAAELNPPLLAHLEAGLLMLGEKWRDASNVLTELLDKTDPSTLTPRILTEAALNLDACQAHLGEVGKSEESYRRALKSDPNSVPARFALASTLVQLDKADEALDLYRSLGKEDPSASLRAVPLMIARVMKSPPERRDRAEVSSTLDALDKALPGSFDVPMLRVSMLSRREKFDEAEDLLKKTRDAHPGRVEPWLALADIRMRRNPAENILPILDEARTKVGDPIEIAIARAAFWALHPGGDARNALAELEQTARSVPEANRVRLLQAIAAAFDRQDDPKSSLGSWKTVTALRPDGLDGHLGALRAAIPLHDENSADAAVSSIRRIDGDEGQLTLSSTAIRFLAFAKPGDAGKIVEARALLTKALATENPRPVLFQALGQLDEQTGNREQAIDDYQKAIRGGDRDPGMIRRIVLMLYASRRFDEAGRLLDNLRADAPLPPNRATLQERLSMRLAPEPQLLASAEKLVASGSANADDYLWLAELLNASPRMAEQEPLLKKALALAPERPEPRFAWIRFLVRLRRTDEAKAAVLEAIR